MRVPCRGGGGDSGGQEHSLVCGQRHLRCSSGAACGAATSRGLSALWQLRGEGGGVPVLRSNTRQSRCWRREGVSCGRCVGQSGPRGLSPLTTPCPARVHEQDEPAHHHRKSFLPSQSQCYPKKIGTEEEKEAWEAKEARLWIVKVKPIYVQDADWSITVNAFRDAKKGTWESNSNFISRKRRSRGRTC